ncbi:uncharacterized protein F5Z01DRAFT_653634 [Emericellopsis atlantica]|uniref:Uncharacterized protein n=1 Tax=Emericellopsis atlantica TaxID=2614577 RepID=A0A9P7ZNP1_9HYPO|nr:uncharacterized protein F5Z01DRAFT_653634 [Emericellopsis atlantica]KAG9255021.1 hypothetical protein F5Z01DRAFT_653634 [Emericellopsis atlantica]
MPLLLFAWGSLTNFVPIFDMGHASRCHCATSRRTDCSLPSLYATVQRPSTARLLITLARLKPICSSFSQP